MRRRRHIEAAVPLLSALQRLKAQVETRTSTLPPPPALQDRPLTARLNVTAAHGGAKGLLGTGPIHSPRQPLRPGGAVRSRARAGAHGRGSAERLGRLGWTTRVVGHLAPVSDPTGPHWPRWQAALSEGFGWPIESFRAWGARAPPWAGFKRRESRKSYSAG